MATTRYLFQVGVTNRYRVLTVKDDATVIVRILTSGVRMHTYTRALRIIIFRTSDLLSDIVAINTLAKLLTHTNHLHTLLVDVTADSSAYAETVIERYGLVRRPKTVKDLIGVDRGQIRATSWLLPSLHSLILGKGLGMLTLTQFRSINHLWMTQTLSTPDLQLLLSTLSDLSMRQSLDSLSLSLNALTSPRECLLALSRTRVAVRVLSITQRHIDLPVCSCFGFF